MWTATGGLVAIRRFESGTDMSLIQQVFGSSPFHPLVEHASKVDECVQLLNPLIEAAVTDDHDELLRLHDQVSKLEYEADQIKHRIREQLPRRFFLPVAREDLDRFLHCQDNIADGVEDFAVILVIRKTHVDEKLVPGFREVVNQVLQVTGTMYTAAAELIQLAETSFEGAGATRILELISNLGEEEWKSDRLQRKLSREVYDMEAELDPVTISFYEKMQRALGQIADSAENTGDMLRAMIGKG
jgi:predicted phosphate transport protein (TIGR00153 family)